MKKKAMMAVAVAMLALVAASCARHTCPAYRGSIAMAEVAE